MPRIYTSESDPIDFCSECFPDEVTAEETYGNLGDGPDDRGNCFDYDSEHPCYGGEYYTCEDCGCRLDASDDGSFWG